VVAERLRGLDRRRKRFAVNKGAKRIEVHDFDPACRSWTAKARRSATSSSAPIRRCIGPSMMDATGW